MTTTYNIPDYLGKIKRGGQKMTVHINFVFWLKVKIDELLGWKGNKCYISYFIRTRLSNM